MIPVLTQSFLGLDYPTLWFLVVGAVFSGYAILDGFDLGAGAWHLFFRKEQSRRVALNAVGPVWDGNEVWLVIGGGTLFAGFPVLYGTLLSALYVPIMLFLACLIFRAISIEFRSKEEMLWWRQMWDVLYSASSMALAVLLGVLLGNVLQGAAIGENYEFIGSSWSFVNPYALLMGATTLALFMMHGAIYLLMKTEGRLFDKLRQLLKVATASFLMLFAITTLYTLLYLPELADRFVHYPWLFVLPIVIFLCLANIPRMATKFHFKRAFLFSALSISLLLVLVAVELYPALWRSTLDPVYTIDIYNAAASDHSLGIMLRFVVVGMPLVSGYTFFVYRTFRGKVKLDEYSY